MCRIILCSAKLRLKNKCYLNEIHVISVDSVHLLDELVSADECNDYERVEGLLCGSVKQLNENRSKPDQLVHMTLLNLARSRPNIFNSDIVIEVELNDYIETIFYVFHGDK